MSFGMFPMKESASHPSPPPRRSATSSWFNSFSIWTLIIFNVLCDGINPVAGRWRETLEEIVFWPKPWVGFSKFQDFDMKSNKYNYESSRIEFCARNIGAKHSPPASRGPPDCLWTHPPVWGPGPFLSHVICGSSSCLIIVFNALSDGIHPVAGRWREPLKCRPVFVKTMGRIFKISRFWHEIEQIWFWE